MSKLEIVNFPHPILKKVALPVDEINSEILRLLSDMAETMYSAPGIGLAAPQVGVSKRIVVIDVDDRDDLEQEKLGLLKLINPQIIERIGTIDSEEGCLSIPDIRGTISRDEMIKVEALDDRGRQVTIEAKGILSRCLQHEIDHLDGILFIDHLSTVRKALIKNKLNQLIEKSRSK